MSIPGDLERARHLALASDETAAKDPLKRTSPSMEIVKVGVTNKVKAAAGKILRASAGAQGGAGRGGDGAGAGPRAGGGNGRAADARGAAQEDALGRLARETPGRGGAAECDGAADPRRGHECSRSRDAVLRPARESQAHGAVLATRG